MYCYAILIERNGNQKKIGDELILYLSERKIFAKYRIFGKIVVLESKTDLKQTISDDIITVSYTHLTLPTNREV